MKAAVYHFIYGPRTERWIVLVYGQDRKAVWDAQFFERANADKFIAENELSVVSEIECENKNGKWSRNDTKRA